MICDTCGAEVQFMIILDTGEYVCCEHCAYWPLGCRCRFGEFGVKEELSLPDQGPMEERTTT